MGLGALMMVLSSLVAELLQKIDFLIMAEIKRCYGNQGKKLKWPHS